MRRGLGLVIGPAHVPRQPDAADAIAIALCHLQQSPASPARTCRGVDVIAFLEGILIEKAADRVVLSTSTASGTRCWSPRAHWRRSARRGSASPPVHTSAGARGLDGAVRLRVHRRAFAVRPSGDRDRRGAEARPGRPLGALARVRSAAPSPPATWTRSRSSRASARRWRPRVILDLKDRLGAGGEPAVDRAARRGPRGAARARPLPAGGAGRPRSHCGPDGDRPVEELLREALQSGGQMTTGRPSEDRTTCGSWPTRWAGRDEIASSTRPCVPAG